MASTTEPVVDPLDDDFRPKTPDNPASSVNDVSQNTPAAVKRQGMDKYGFNPRNAKSRNLRCVEEATRFFLGPMPVEEFLKRFLPDISLAGMPSSKDAFKDVPVDEKIEKKIYDPLSEALNYLNGARCPGYEFHITATRGEGEVELGDMKPDISLYSETVDKEAYMKNGHAFANMGYAHLFIEVKPFSRPDCFHDPPASTPTKSADRSTHKFLLNVAPSNQQKAQEDLGQIVSYAVEACARQHRSFYFSISVHGTKARLIRWDRSGAIATESFDLHKNPEWLCEFLWKFAHGTDEDRGFDMTVARAGKEDERLFKTVVKKHVQLQTGLSGKPLADALDEHYEPKKVAIAHVLEDGSSSPIGVRQYLISRPVISPLSMASRATRGYWAVCRTTRKIVFLKDTWRCNVDNMVKEGTILRTLMEKQVLNIPDLVCHGDVPLKFPLDATGSMPTDSKEKLDSNYQSSRNHEFVDADWVCGQALPHTRRLIPHRHYRLVLGIVGYSLERLEGTKELLHATFDGYQAMIDALNKAGLLHRDISVGNILLVRDSPKGERRGYLIDWELSCPAVRKGNPQRNYERTGTWPFMSSRLFSEPKNFVHNITDDMESMMYVVLYSGLRWLPHNLDGTPLHAFMTQFFDNGKTQENGFISSGDAKVGNKYTRRHTDQITFKCQEFSSWLTTVMHYHHPLVDDEKYKGKWNDPIHLYNFWKEFLQTEQLPCDDRTTREDLPDEPPSTADQPQGATVASRHSSPFTSSAHHSSEPSKARGKSVARKTTDPRTRSNESSSQSQNQRVTRSMSRQRAGKQPQAPP